MQNEKSGSRDAGWTPQKRAQFLRRVSATGQVRAAVAACGLSAQSVYKLRRRDPAFARRWDAALARCHVRRAEALASVYADFLHRAGEIAASRMRPLDPVNSINRASTNGGTPSRSLDTVTFGNFVSTAPVASPAQIDRGTAVSCFEDTQSLP